MNFRGISTRLGLIAVIVGTGILALGLVYASTERYEALAVAHERAALAERVRAGLLGIDQRLRIDTQELAQRVERGFGTTKPEFTARLPQMAHIVAEGLRFTRPLAIDLYDASFQPSVHLAASNHPSVHCVAVIKLAGESALTTSPASGRCVVGRRVHYTAVWPIENKRRLGYFVYTADWTQRVIDHMAFGTSALRVSATGNKTLYQSPQWPTDVAREKFLFVEQVIPAVAPGDPEILITLAEDETEFFAKLAQVGRSTLQLTAVLVMMALIAAIVLLEKSAIGPMRALTRQLQRIREDRGHLGRHVNIAGNTEVTELARGFNDMTTELNEIYGDMERLAFSDTLTGLANRGRFHTWLEQAIVTARGQGHGFAVFLMDLDRFKDINDTLGHHIGDQLLQQVAARLRDKLRDGDFVARMGGDEFAVLLPAATAKEADTAARLLVQAVRTPFAIDEYQLDIGVSIGIAMCPDHGIDVSSLLQHADVAMYTAKNGATGHLFYDPRMNQHSVARLTLVGELRQALALEQFVLHYQPKIDLKTSRAIGLEALARWSHPNGELVSPDRFIPVLEQTGMIRSLTHWVLGEAARQASELRKAGMSIPISVNLSARDLQYPLLPEEFGKRLAQHNATADWIELEISETAAMVDTPGVRDVITRLAAMGFKLAIDDFGTGYSSLSYLKKLPLQVVKIDTSFIAGMLYDENDAAVVRTSIDLAHNLGLKVIAEGVADGSVLARLKGLGCDIAQGLYISRPLAADELLPWFAKSSWSLGVPVVGRSFRSATGLSE